MAPKLEKYACLGLKVYIGTTLILCTLGALRLFVYLITGA